MARQWLTSTGRFVQEDGDDEFLLSGGSFVNHDQAAATTTDAFYYRNVTRTRKPDYPVGIDWSNPLTKGLKAFIININGQAIDLVSGEIGVKTGVSSTVDITGRSLTANGSDKITFDNLVHGIGTGAYTMNIEYMWDGTAATWQTAMSLPTCSDIGIYIPRSNTQTYLALDSTSDAADSFTSISVTANQYDVFSVSCSGSGTTQKGYKNGVYIESVPGAVTYTEGGTTGLDLFVGQGTEWGYGSISYVALWSDQISDSEQKKFYDNPYQLLQPIRQPVFISTAAAPPSTSANDEYYKTLLTMSSF